MSGNKPKDNRLATLIQPNFGENTKAVSIESPEVPKEKFSPPATAMQILVPIDKIKCYEHNPCVSRNEKYDEIKDSIRAVGLEQYFKITHRPGTDHYIIHGGGNTRLTILKELFAETSDPKYSPILCNYEPLSPDKILLCKHMIENDLHGRMLFIDKARAILNFKDMTEVEKKNWSIPLQKMRQNMR